MEKQENIMGTKPVFPLLVSMAIPPMVSMLIQSLYNVVDSIFVARLSEEALTAVSLVYPLQNLSLAASVGLGIGMSSCISRSLGARRQKEAEEAVSHGMLFTAIQGFLFILIGWFLSKPFLQMFTDNQEILEMAVQYSKIVICLAFGSHFHITIEKIFQSTGNMVVPMILQGVGALINIILDPVLIFGLGGFPAMGIKGAAVATIIGQMAACALALLLQTRNRELRIPVRGFCFRKEMAARIYQVAVPSGLLMAMPSALVGILNGILHPFSDRAVAVLGLYFKVQSFVYMPANGLVQGLRPIAGYNYGAGYYGRLRKTVRSALQIAGGIMIFGTVLFAGFTRPIMGLFHASPDLMNMGCQALRIISLGFFVSIFSIIYAGTFEGLGKGLHSLSISILRQMSILPVLALVLSRIIGVTGVWIAFPVTELIAGIYAICLWRHSKERMGIRGEGPQVQPAREIGKGY
ncbi:MAG: MATE family efflux transporter [Blautia sp.]